jgi:hypothetical protein
MKKTLLILGAVAAVAASASAQGVVYISSPSTAGFNSVSSSPGDSGPSGTFADFYTGTASLEIFSIVYSGTAANDATAINALAAAGNESGAALALTSDGFTQQTIGGASSQVFAIGTGSISAPGDFNLGNASSLPAASDYLFAILATAGNMEGVLVLNNPAAVGSTGYSPGAASPGLPNNISADWGNNQNVLLAPTSTPEPASLALAGLGGLSMLFLRRRKA